MSNLIKDAALLITIGSRLGSTERRSASLETAILHTLTYADIFDYPLTLPEIHRYLTAQQATVHDVATALDGLTRAGVVAHRHLYYALPGRESIIQTRDRRSAVAAAMWRKALRYGRIIAALPFVRMVAITGSLSMSNTDAGTDIDFMLVSAPGRLWTCRALVLLVARLARLEGVNLCPNYIVASNALEFSERSLYVAHELTQMVPLSGFQVYDLVRCLNRWTDDYLPNADGVPQPLLAAGHPSRWQGVLEAVLAILPVERFEAWEMRRKIQRLSREQSGSPEAYFSSDVCKGHVDRHKQQTEVQLRQRLETLRSI